MIVTPINSNRIEIPMIQTGCCKSEFDSNYSVHLNGIIRQDEFQQSIANINEKISSRMPLIICLIIFIICLVGGIGLFVAGGVTAGASKTRGFPVLVGVGLGVVFLGTIIFMIGACIMQARFASRLQQAVREESAKYSTRSPTPCSWRLDAMRIATGAYQRRRTRVVYRILIEIGHSVGQGYNNAPQQSSYFSQQNGMAPPPLYSSNSAGTFCPQCGKPRSNSSAKFCSSCGSSYYV